MEELYQGQRRLLRIDNSLEEVESWIDKVESLVDRLIKDTKDSMQHLHKVMAELMSKVTLVTSALNAGESNTRVASPQNLRAPKLHYYEGAKDTKELENFLFNME